MSEATDSGTATETTPLFGEQQQGHQQSAENTNNRSGSNNGENLNDTAPAGLLANSAHDGKRPLFLLAIAIGIYLAAIDQTLTMASYARIGNELQALKSVGWIVTSYMLAMTSCQPLFGKLSDIFGRKECLLAGFSLFAIGCFACGLSQDILQLCISRGITGVGAAGINSVTSILVTDLVPLRDRGLWQGYIQMVFAAGMASGAPVGGLLADQLGWRWCFLGQAPICCASIVVIYFVLDLPRPEQNNLSDKIRRIDFLGALLLILTVTAILLGLDSGANIGWQQVGTIAPLAAVPILMTIFIQVESKYATNPFVPGHVIFHRSLFAGFLVCFFNMACQFTLYFFTPLFLQTVLAFSATTSGAMLVPGIVAGVLATLLGGWVIKRTGKFYCVNIASHGLLAIGGLVTAQGIWFKILGVELAGLALAQAGGGAGNASLVVALLANATPEDTAVVIASSFLFRALGGSIGIGISSAVMQQVLRSQLASRLHDGDQAHEIEDRVRKSLDYINELPGPIALQVRESYQWATLASAAPAVIFGMIAFCVSLFIREKKLSR